MRVVRTVSSISTVDVQGTELHRLEFRSKSNSRAVREKRVEMSDPTSPLSGQELTTIVFCLRHFAPQKGI